VINIEWDFADQNDSCVFFDRFNVSIKMASNRLIKTEHRLANFI
jgi:hypothetical protein